MGRIILFTVILCAGCASSLPLPTSDDVVFFQTIDQTVTLESITNARMIYTVKCSGCHGLYLPESYRPDRWPAIINEMGKKANVTMDEEEKIRLYMTLYSLKHSRHDNDSVLSVPPEK